MRTLNVRPAKRAKLVDTLLTWYSREGRVLPWRNISNPYRILLSEIMLQQTQVNRVLLKYPLFLRRFPTLASLARARRRDVVIAWQGMGYNNRAARLHALARIVARDHHGRIPDEFDALFSLPGIGRYTANALLASAFGRQVPAVDVNARRFLSRCLWRMSTTGDLRSEREVWQCAAELLPRGRAYEWNQALMDIGASVCTARRPRCELCPVSPLCASRPSMVILRHSQKKRERLFDGIPNRLYRGRIIEELRRERKGITPHRLGKRVRHRFSSRHHPWIRALLEGLQKDGLVTVHGRGPFRSQRVSLA